jgi:hypothetical protein
MLSLLCRIDNELERAIISHAASSTFTDSSGSFFWIKNQILDSYNQTRPRNSQILSIIVIPKAQDRLVVSIELGVYDYRFEVRGRKIGAVLSGMLPLGRVMVMTHRYQPRD